STPSTTTPGRPPPHLPAIRKMRLAMARNRRQPAPDPIDELVQLAIDLDLTALAAVLPDMLRRAEQEGLAYTDFAQSLLRAEIDARRERRLTRSLHRSHLGKVHGI